MAPEKGLPIGPIRGCGGSQSMAVAVCLFSTFKFGSLFKQNHMDPLVDLFQHPTLSEVPRQRAGGGYLFSSAEIRGLEISWKSCLRCKHYKPLLTTIK